MTTSVFVQLFTWLTRPGQLLVGVLLLLFVLSAIGVVLAAHETRARYADLQALEKSADDLDSEYERLLLEQSAWADYSRIDQLAREELAMDSPATGSWVLLEEGKP